MSFKLNIDKRNSIEGKVAMHELTQVQFLAPNVPLTPPGLILGCRAGVSPEHSWT